jgi:hypothetical protein
MASEKKKKRPEGILVVKGDSDAADKALEEAGIDATFFIESHGNDQDAVADALKNTLMKDLKAEEGVVLRIMKFHPVVEKEKLYSGFVECNFVARDPQTLMYLALRYGPSAVEITHPDEVRLSQAELQNMVADTSASVQVIIGKLMEKMVPEEKAKVFREGLGLDI